MIARLTKFAAWLPLLLAIAACSGSQDAKPKAAAVPVPLDTLALLNATYLSEFVPNGSVKLTNGSYADSANLVWVKLTKRLDGDLNADGAQDAAVFLTTNAGAGGVFVDLVAMINDQGAPRLVGKTSLGDRIGLDSLYLDQGDIVVHLTTHAPQDPLCCPTQKEVRRYAVEGGRLIAR